MRNSPDHHHGPFVQDSRGPGLLRRLLGGGATDPTAPHAHGDRSTSTMHVDPPATPPRPSARTTMAPYAKPAGPKPRPLGLRILGWLWRAFGIRFVIAAVALIAVGIGSLRDGPDAVDDLRQLNDRIEQRELERAPTPAPGGRDAGELRATVDTVEFDRIVLREADGTEHRWVMDSDQFGELIQLSGREVRARWRVEEAGTTFVSAVPVAPPAGDGSSGFVA